MTNDWQTVSWHDGKVRLLDQNALPRELKWLEFADWRGVGDAIRVMTVRGAPAIGATAALGLALGARQIESESRHEFLRAFDDMAREFATARPTAVNLCWAIERMSQVAQATPGDADAIRGALLDEAHN